MSEFNEMYKKAKAKLEAESFEHGTPQDAIRGMCLEWLEWAANNDAKAVELITDGKKNTQKAYKAMEGYARSKKGASACVKLEPLEAMGCIMEYYGIGKDKAHQQLESGLMYHLMMSECKKCKPYGMDEQVTEAAPVPEPAKATPVTDSEKKPYEKPKLEEVSPSFSFDDFDSELEGLL